MSRRNNAISHTISIGDFEVSSLLAGTKTGDDPQSIFGMNVDSTEFKAVSDKNFIPSDKTQFFYSPTVVKTKTDVILFDTGISAEEIISALTSAGVAAHEITLVVLTHMHGDHIAGMIDVHGKPTFPNARYVTGQKEYEAWSALDAPQFNTHVKPFAEKMTFIAPDQSVVSGVTSIEAFGHTPGHMAYRLESAGEQLVLIADVANHYVWSLAYPDWEVKFDMDKSAAAKTRRRVLGMLAADKIPFCGYHMPFPGTGYVETRGDGFHYVPTSYQMMLD